MDLISAFFKGRYNVGLGLANYVGIDNETLKKVNTLKDFIKYADRETLDLLLNNENFLKYFLTNEDARYIICNNPELKEIIYCQDNINRLLNTLDSEFNLVNSDGKLIIKTPFTPVGSCHYGNNYESSYDDRFIIGTNGASDRENTSNFYSNEKFDLTHIDSVLVQSYVYYNYYSPTVYVGFYSDNTQTNKTFDSSGAYTVSSTNTYEFEINTKNLRGFYYIKFSFYDNYVDHIEQCKMSIDKIIFKPERRL
ncbi:hypothetical protein [Abyssisolibacter fermentans]|uniref:hypothetical protein n=1 Tax=Abyssisolibacter fermentans TaxID=1766203 RepID=UPI0008351947|nr:hypothetical protein [Abyssisolibacter fermentans]